MATYKGKSRLKAADELRLRAESQLSSKKSERLKPLTESEVQRLIHEVEVHQIELEMQNAELRQSRDALETALENCTDLYDFAPVGYVTLDRSGSILAINLTGSSLIGMERSGLIGRYLGQFVATADRSSFSAFLGRIFSSQGKVACEVGLLNNRGEPLIVQIEAMAAVADQKCRIALIDITGRKQAENALRESEERMYRLTEMAADAIIMLDDSGMVTFCNAAAERMFGCPAEEITGCFFHRFFIPERLHATAEQGFARFREQGTGPLVGRTTEVVALRKNGMEFPLELSVSALNLRGKWHAIAIMRDITDRKVLELTLRHDSTHDSLTGLYNRAFFTEELKRLAQGRMFPMSIVMGDLNDLKKVNDTLGHEAGDHLICLAARIILEAFRAEDIVARIGGDEFAALLPQTDMKVAEEAVERIMNRAEIISGKVSIAFGIATADSKEQLEEALRLSDERMYQHKSTQKEL